MSERRDRRQESRDLKQSPSVSTLLAPASQGDHVFRLQLVSHTNHKYVQVEVNNVISAKNDAAGPDTIFELHRFSVPAPTSASSSPSFVTRYAIRSPFGKFINVDENIDLLLKDRANKDTGIKADREAAADREKLFELITVKNKEGQTNIALRAQDDIFLTVDPVDGKFKVAKSASYTAIISAAANAAAAAAAAAANATPAPLSPSGATASPPAAAPAVAAKPSLPSYSSLPSELFTPLWLDERSPLSLGGRFALLTAHDKYVCIEPSGKVIANRGELSVWEPLELLSVSLTQVAFQTVHGTYLSLDHTSPRLVLEATSLAVGANEKFTYEEIDAEKGIYAFRASNGLYVCAQGNHSVTGSSSTRGPWESFRLVPVSVDQ